MASAASEEEMQQAAFKSWSTHPHSPEQLDRPITGEFEELYMTYRSRVWALCLRMTGNPDDADDLTEETFVRLLQKLDTFRGDSAFSTWLRRITINVVLLRFQKASWRHETSMEALAAPDPVSSRPQQMEFGGFDAWLMGTVDRITLQQALDRLPPGFKAVLILHDIEGYEHVEISEIMGCSIGTSKSQLHKARLKMRELLQRTPTEQPRSPKRTADGAPYTSSTNEQPLVQFPFMASHGHSASTLAA